jgi:PDZ domain
MSSRPWYDRDAARRVGRRFERLLLGLNAVLLALLAVGLRGFGTVIPKPWRRSGPRGGTEAGHGARRELMRHGTVIGPSLGVALAPNQLTRSLSLDGVLVMRLEPGGAGEGAGLRPTRRDLFGSIDLGDVILAIDHDATGSTEDFFAALEDREPGEEATLTILREGQRMTLPITLGREA